MTTPTIDECIEWLTCCEQYFLNRPTGGEDRAHWANVYNAENIKLIRARLIAAEEAKKLVEGQDALIRRFCARLKAAEDLADELNDAASNYDMPEDFITRAENALAAWRNECGK